jgi:HPt (histidine-containing phosphotransfer) domain-containing protein
MIFDKNLLLEKLGNDEEAYTEIINIFLTDIPEQIDALKNAISTKNSSLIQRQAHTIKGAAGNMGATVLQKVAFEMEEAGRNKNSNVDDFMQKLEKEFQNVKKIVHFN